MKRGFWCCGFAQDSERTIHELVKYWNFKVILTSSFVIGRALDSNAGTTTLLGGFSLSLAVDQN